MFIAALLSYIEENVVGPIHQYNQQFNGQTYNTQQSGYENILEKA